MAGRVEETHCKKLKKRRHSDQQEISDFTDDDTTYVAVTSFPRGNIEDIVDEVWTELGMPTRPLKEFLALRSGYRSNSAVDFPHNKAYEDAELHGKYQNYIEHSPKAKSRLREAVERVCSGENITLVCYETGGQKCHRHILVDIIQERVQSREECHFTFTA